MTDALGYKCTDPPEWMRITTMVNRLLPSDDVGGCTAPPIDWISWFPWIRERVATWNYEQMGGTIGCSSHAVRTQVGKWVKEGKLSAARKRRGARLWSDTLEARARELLGEGLTLAETARRMRIHPTTITHHFAKLGEAPWRRAG